MNVIICSTKSQMEFLEIYVRRMKKIKISVEILSCNILHINL